MPSTPIYRQRGLWIAHLPTSFGSVELLCGEGDTPDLQEIKLAEQFLNATEDRLVTVRRSVFALPWLWRPIRLAVNDEGRLGIQFRNRMTGSQRGMFFADEHSSFSTRRPDVTVTAEDKRKLTEHHP